MEFRPCIDIHDGKVKQIVGGSLFEDGQSHVKENFVSEVDAPFYARMYEKLHIKGGHVILLNGKDTPGYEATKEQAKAALNAYPGGLQVGGGINPDNAWEFIGAGASHVIVTSYVFKDGKMDQNAMDKMVDAVSPKRLVLDLSVRLKDGRYMIVTDRWQKFTDVELTDDLLWSLSEKCDEFLIHAVDVEGKASGVDKELIAILGAWGGHRQITYAGGIHDFSDLDIVGEFGLGRVNATVGSALEIFGGNMKLEEVLACCNEKSKYMFG